MSGPAPRRSALFLPASNARAVEKARELTADVVILDLEDAVAPEAKEGARSAALAAVKQGFGDSAAVIRVNAPETRWGADDLDAVRASGAGVLVPKIRNAGDVQTCRDRLGSETPLWVMIETCESLGRLQDIAEAGVQGMVLGVNDLALEGVCNGFSDDARLEAECVAAAAMGYDGKSLIHPRQIPVCNAAFSPDAAAIDWATRVRDAFASGDGGVIQVDGKMVEALHLVQAERILGMVS